MYLSPYLFFLILCSVNVVFLVSGAGGQISPETLQSDIPAVIGDRTNFLIPFGSLISLVHLSAPLCPQALNLPSTSLVVCSILGSRPIFFQVFSSPSPTD